MVIIRTWADLLRAILTLYPRNSRRRSFAKEDEKWKEKEEEFYLRICGISRCLFRVSSSSFQPFRFVLWFYEREGKAPFCKCATAGVTVVPSVLYLLTSFTFSFFFAVPYSTSEFSFLAFLRSFVFLSLFVPGFGGKPKN